MKGLLTVLWLKSIKGIGNRTVQKLDEATHHNLESLWLMKRNELINLKVLNDSQTTDLINNRSYEACQKHLESCLNNGIAIVSPWGSTSSENYYPEQLRHIYDSPSVLYMKGRLELLKNKCVAIVGTRNPTEQGVKTALCFSEVISKQEISVVSGMAEGIDAAAHIGSFKGDGGSIAVLGSGIDRPYPAINRNIFNRLTTEGLLISEHPMGTQPQKGYFAKRNRIISGLSEGIVVIEAGARSGALITANYALDQGKSIYAVPGSIYSSRHMGCHMLIRQGGQLVTNAQEVLDDLTLSAQWKTMDKDPALESSKACYHGLYGTLLQVIRELEPIMLEDLLKYVKADRATVFEYTLSLMMDGIVSRGHDGAFRITES